MHKGTISVWVLWSLALVAALALYGCETTPDAGDRTAPEIALFEAGHLGALTATSGSELRVAPRQCSDLGLVTARGWELQPYHLLPIDSAPLYELRVLATDLGGIARIEAALAGAQHNARVLAPPGAIVELRDLDGADAVGPYTYVVADLSAEPPRTAGELRFSLGTALDLAMSFAQQPLVLYLTAVDFADNRRNWAITLGGAVHICR